MPRKQRFKPSRKPRPGEAMGETLVGNRPEVPVNTEPARGREASASSTPDATPRPRSSTPAVIE